MKTAALYAKRINSACRLCRRRNEIDSPVMVSGTNVPFRIKGSQVKATVFGTETHYCLRCFRALVSAAMKSSPEIREAVTSNASFSKLLLGYGMDHLCVGQSTLLGGRDWVLVPNVVCPEDDMLRPFWDQVREEVQV